MVVEVIGVDAVEHGGAGRGGAGAGLPRAGSDGATAAGSGPRAERGAAGRSEWMAPPRMRARMRTTMPGPLYGEGHHQRRVVREDVGMLARLARAGRRRNRRP